LLILEWKWDDIVMDSVMGLPRSKEGNDSVWLIIHRLTKSAHFIPVTKDDAAKLADLYVKVIVKLHGIPRTIVSDRDERFTSNAWKFVHKRLRTKLLYSMAFNPQTNGQSERTI